MVYASHIALALVPVPANSAEQFQVAFGDFLEGIVQRITGGDTEPSVDQAADGGYAQEPVSNVAQFPSDSKQTLREIQQNLTDLGYAPGAADGVMGKRTRQAIYEYQRAAGLRVDGVASTELLASLREHRAAYGVPERNTAALSSNEVREIQRRLNELGYTSGPVDGRVSPGTESAIYAYQRESGLTADGRPTRELLMSLRSQARADTGTASAANQRVIKVPLSSSLRRSVKTLYYECERQVNAERSSEGLPAIQLVSPLELQQDDQEESRRMIGDVYQYHATSGGTAGAGVPAGKSYLEAMQDQSDMLAARQMARANERLNRYSGAQIKHEERSSAMLEIEECVASKRR